MLQVAIIPCKPTDIFSFLSPLFNELKILEKEGISVECNDEKFFLKAFLVLASGDIPGVAELIHHTGHSSLHGCRQCLIKSVSAISPVGRGSGRYYRGSHILDEERKKEDFCVGDPVSVIFFKYLKHLNMVLVVVTTI